MIPLSRPQRLGLIAGALLVVALPFWLAAAPAAQAAADGAAKAATPALTVTVTRATPGQWPLTLPVFDAGRRAAQVDAAQALYDEALANYVGQARQAVREVEQALVRLNSASTRENDAQRAADGYDTAFRAADQRWRVGAGSLLDVEVARRLAVVSRTQLIAVQRERIAAWISLYRAAGGGWSPDQTTPDGAA